MRRAIYNNRGSIVLMLLAVVLGVSMGLFVYYQDHYAYAVIGGVGNLGDPSTQSVHKHNLSVNGPGPIKATSEDEICVFCHTPHRSIQNATWLINAPLWNHELSNVASYTINSAGDLINNGIGNGILLTTPLNPPDGASALCLSCHDGTIAVGATRSRGLIAMQGADTDGSMQSSAHGYIGTDLTTHHVVSVPMNQALLDAANANCVQAGVTMKLQYPWTAGVDARSNVLLRPTTATGPDASAQPGVDGSTPLGVDATLIGVYRSGYRYGVQCSTCHDPHLWWNSPSNSCSTCNFLVNGACANDKAAEGCTSNISPLCSTCHISC